MTKLNRNGVVYEFVCPNCGKGALRSTLQTVAVWDYTDMEVYNGCEVSMDADNYTEVDEAEGAVVGCKACGHVLEGITDPEEVIKDDRFWRKI